MGIISWKQTQKKKTKHFLVLVFVSSLYIGSKTNRLYKLHTWGLLYQARFLKCGSDFYYSNILHIEYKNIF